MSTLERFIENGLKDAETRLTRRMPPPVRDHPLAIEVVASSAIGGFVARSVHLLRVAAESSVAARLMRSVTSAWRTAGRRERHASLGLGLMVAVLVHVFLLWLRGLPVGWVWSIVPAILAAIGIVLTVSARSPGSARGELQPGKGR